MSEESSQVIETPVVETPNSGSVETRVIEAPKAPAATDNSTTEENTKEKLAPKLSKIRAREAKIVEEKAEAQRLRTEATEKLQEAEAIRANVELLKKSPSKALAGLGITFNDIAKALLEEEENGDATPSELDGVKQSIADIEKTLKAEKEQKEATEQAALDSQLDAAISGIKVKIDEHIDSNSEKYDLVLSTENKDLVHQIMLEGWKQNGEVMHYTEACDLAEEYLEKKISEEAAKLSKSKKATKFFVPPQAPKASKTSFSRTLSSKGAAPMAAAGEQTTDLSKLSHDERVKVLAKRIRYY